MRSATKRFVFIFTRSACRPDMAGDPSSADAVLALAAELAYLEIWPETFLGEMPMEHEGLTS